MAVVSGGAIATGAFCARGETRAPSVGSLLGHVCAPCAAGVTSSGGTSVECIACGDRECAAGPTVDIVAALSVADPDVFPHRAKVYIEVEAAARAGTSGVRAAQVTRLEDPLVVDRTPPSVGGVFLGVAPRVAGGSGSEGGMRVNGTDGTDAAFMTAEAPPQQQRSIIIERPSGDYDASLPCAACAALQLSFWGQTDHVAIYWAGFADPESDVVRFEVCVGTSAEMPGDVAPCSEAAAANASIVALGATEGRPLLQHGAAYVVTVIATNGVGLRSNASARFVVDTALPSMEYVRGGQSSGAVAKSQTFTDMVLGSMLGATGAHAPVVGYLWCAASASFAGDVAAVLPGADLLDTGICDILPVRRELVLAADLNFTVGVAEYALEMALGSWYRIVAAPVSASGVVGAVAWSEPVHIGKLEAVLTAESASELLFHAEKVHLASPDGRPDPSVGVMSVLSVPAGAVAGAVDLTVEILEYNPHDNASHAALEIEGFDGEGMVRPRQQASGVPERYHYADYSFAIEAAPAGSSGTQDPAKHFPLSEPAEMSFAFNQEVMVPESANTRVDPEKFARLAPVMMLYDVGLGEWQRARDTCGAAQLHEATDRMRSLHECRVCHFTQFAMFFQAAPHALVAAAYDEAQRGWALNASASFDYDDGQIVGFEWEILGAVEAVPMNRQQALRSPEHAVVETADYRTIGTLPRSAFADGGLVLHTNASRIELADPWRAFTRVELLGEELLPEMPSAFVFRLVVRDNDNATDALLVLLDLACKDLEATDCVYIVADPPADEATASFASSPGGIALWCVLVVLCAAALALWVRHRRATAAADAALHSDSATELRRATAMEMMDNPLRDGMSIDGGSLTAYDTAVAGGGVRLSVGGESEPSASLTMGKKSMFSSTLVSQDTFEKVEEEADVVFEDNALLMGRASMADTFLPSGPAVMSGGDGGVNGAPSSAGGDHVVETQNPLLAVGTVNGVTEQDSQLRQTVNPMYANNESVPLLKTVDGAGRPTRRRTMAAALTDFREDKDSRMGKLLGRLGLLFKG